MKVDVQAVEAELNRIQRELTNTEVRTSLVNLVVFSPDAKRTMADNALNYLLGKRAARVIHVVDGNEPESSLEVSARCFVDIQKKGVCFEEIVIINGADRAGGAPGSWIPLLVRDIPTLVLWMDRLTNKGELLAHAEEQADKLVIDSEHSVSLGDDQFALMEEVRAGVARGSAISDFTWKRLRPLRRLLASAFDKDGRSQWLGEVSSVRLSGQTTTAAWYLGLWMAERLGWSNPSLGDLGVEFLDAQRRPVSVAVTSPIPGCDLSVSVDFHARGSLDILASPEGCVDVQDSGVDVDHSIMTAPSNGQILLEEVDAMYSDGLFRAAINVLGESAM